MCVFVGGSGREAQVSLGIAVTCVTNCVIKVAQKCVVWTCGDFLREPRALPTDLCFESPINPSGQCQIHSAQRRPWQNYSNQE